MSLTTRLVECLQIERINFTNNQFTWLLQNFRKNKTKFFVAERQIHPIRFKQTIRQLIAGQLQFISQIHQRKYVEETVRYEDAINSILQ